MSSTEPPDGSTPPSGEPTPPPPPTNPSTVPPPDPAMAPPPPPPPAGAAAPAPGVPGAGDVAGQPGNLLDRFLARLIDGIIVGVVIAILNFILQAGMSYWTATFISGVIGAVLVTGYFVYFESERGQTVGKQVMKLKTVGPDGHSNPTVNEAVKRNIWNAFQIVPCLGPLAALASVILIAIGINGDPVNRQHWFDKFAGGTKVLKVG